MKIALTVKTNAKQDEVEQLSAGEFRVQVKAPPREGRANEAVINALARHFKIPKSRITIIAGQSSKRKLAKIEG